jgi:nucleoside-diphosphate-sugar epimerase
MTADVDALERDLSAPDPRVAEAIAGDLVVLGAGGKMGPGLARLAARSLRAAGRGDRVVAVSRFTTPGLREGLERDGVETVACDLLDRGAVGRLPRAGSVVFMAGQKFGTEGDPAATWAANTLLPAIAAEHYRDARAVAFSTGNVYPLWPAASDGPAEDDPVGPAGEYAQSALGRERVLEFLARRHGTPLAILRLNYAVEPRYGVLRDLADRIVAGDPVDLSMGRVNVIWQRDAVVLALRALALAACPPLRLNLTGPAVAVRDLAGRLGARLGRAPRFAGTEAPTALLADASRCAALLGPPPTPLDTMVERVADWVAAGGPGLGKPTRFEEREGRF